MTVQPGTSEPSYFAPPDPAAVIVALVGGLGNQLFQAAAGLALSLRCGAPLQFDLAFYKEGRRAHYELAPYPHGATLVNIGRLSKPGRLAQFAARLVGRSPPARFAGYCGARYHQPGFAFDPGFNQLVPPCHLNGYFQSERYFLDTRAAVIDILHPRRAAEPLQPELLAALARDNTVSVHIRRGDYANNSTVRAVHGLLGADYYRAAFEEVAQHVAEPAFFVFSDDTTAAREVLAGLNNVRFLEGGSALQDLLAMSLCRHHVIANSSFSWWGAYFDRREGGLTIAPKQWFADKGLKMFNIRDLLPSSWFKV